MHIRNASSPALSIDRLEPRTMLSSSKPLLIYQFDKQDLTVHEHAGSSILKITRSGAPAWGTWKHNDDDDDKKGKAPKHIRLTYEIIPLTATPGQDYVPATGELKLRRNERTTHISIPILDDSLVEGATPERFKVALKSVSHGRLGSRSEAVVSIIDNDTAPPPAPARLSVNNATIIEGDTGQKELLFTVSLDAPSIEPVSVTYATSDITAAAGVDYQSTSGSVQFAPGVLTQTISIPINGDTAEESDETIKIELSAAAGATISDSVGIGTIQDDDDGTKPPNPGDPVITIADRASIEGNGGEASLEFVVTLSRAAQSPVTVQYQSADGTATLSDGDYLAAQGTLTFAPGQTVATIPVRTIGDHAFEAHEAFMLQLSSPSGATLLTGSAIGTILNDDNAPPFVMVTGDAVSEGNVGNKNLVFTLSLSAPSLLPITVSYTTVAGTATASADFLPVTGTAAFAPGQTIAEVEVPVTGDMRFESDEQLALRLVSAVNATISPDDSATGKIVNDDAMPQISIADSTVAEGDAGMADLTFAVSLSNPSDQTIVVDFTTANGSATAAATDYLSAAGQVVFLPGETSKTVTVRVQGDTNAESDETVQLMLANPVGATLADPQAAGNIVNDDETVDPGPEPVVGVTARLAPDPLDPSKTALFVMGTDKPENIRLIGRKNSAALTVRANGKRIGSFSPTGRIIVQAGAGNDIVRVEDTPLPAWLFGGGGKDRLTGGRGNDLLAGNEGRDLLVGGAGNDSMLGGGAADIMLGGNGNDLLIGASVTVENDPLALYRFATRRINKSLILDDRAPDTLAGNFGGDRLFANTRRPGTLDRVNDRSPSNWVNDL